MKIIYKTGDLFTAPEPIIVHGCNARGAFGSGVAKIMREKHPEAFRLYRKAFENNCLRLGDVVWAYSHGRFIANAITQQNYGYDGALYVDYEAIALVFQAINLRFEPFSDRPGAISAALPLLGAGLAGGDWSIISELIESQMTMVQPVVYTLDGKIPTQK